MAGGKDLILIIAIKKNESAVKRVQSGCLRALHQKDETGAVRGFVIGREPNGLEVWVAVGRGAVWQPFRISRLPKGPIEGFQTILGLAHHQRALASSKGAREQLGQCLLQCRSGEVIEPDLRHCSS